MAPDTKDTKKGGADRAVGDDTPATREARAAGAALSTEQHTAATTPKLAPEQKGLDADGKPLAKVGADELPEVLGTAYDFVDGDSLMRYAPLTPLDEVGLDEKEITSLRARGVIRRATPAEHAQIQAREGATEAQTLGPARSQTVIVTTAAAPAKGRAAGKSGAAASGASGEPSTDDESVREDYASWKKDDLATEAASRELDVEGSGADGNVLADDLRSALIEDDLARAKAGK